MGRIRFQKIIGENEGHHGFTLLEMVLVLGIFTILLVIALPGLRKPLAYYQLRSTAVQLASDIRWLRQQSIYGKAVSVNLQVAPLDGFYQIRDNTKVVLHRILPPGLKFTRVVLDKNILHFTLTGAPGSGGRIVLENSFGKTCTVFIMPSSGRIRVDCEVMD